MLMISVAAPGPRQLPPLVIHPDGQPRWPDGREIDARRTISGMAFNHWTRASQST
jgi:hypothetical protein